MWMTLKAPSTHPYQYPDLDVYLEIYLIKKNHLLHTSTVTKSDKKLETLFGPLITLFGSHYREIGINDMKH